MTLFLCEDSGNVLVGLLERGKFSSSLDKARVLFQMASQKPLQEVLPQQLGDILRKDLLAGLLEWI